MRVGTTALILALVATFVLAGCHTSAHVASSKVDRTDEIVPPSDNHHPIKMAQMLNIYAEFTGAELEIGEGVRQVSGYIPMRSTPSMTRAQAVDYLDYLFLQVGVVADHPTPKRVVLRLK